MLWTFTQEALHLTSVTPMPTVARRLPGGSSPGGYHEWMARLLQPRQRPTWQIATPAVLLLTAFIVPGLLILAGNGEPAFNGVDTLWQAYVFTLHTPLWDQVNVLLNSVGYVGMLVLQLLLGVILLLWQRPRTALFVMVAGVTALALTQLAKVVVGRQRPEGAKVLTDTGSYPSGHVSATTTFLVVMVVLIDRFWIKALAALGILAMMISRTYLSAHWLSDVLGAACLGTGLVLLLWVPFRSICIAENERTGPIWRAKASQHRQAAGPQE
ncbi:phosphatase PAP2 family protein [Paenarthrobacter sp. NPDC089714]|uniref:phosphatase PAP2 family protein n=1 Tax=Paenarthrobacter sp. NPDC089714 TaxID=3364377 RepID=UPI0037F81DB4